MKPEEKASSHGSPTARSAILLINACEHGRCDCLRPDKLGSLFGGNGVGRQRTVDTVPENHVIAERIHCSSVCNGYADGVCRDTATIILYIFRNTILRNSFSRL